MRILVVAACPLPWPRGTPIRIHRMAEALVACGHDVHVATYSLGDRRMSTSYTVHRVGRENTRVGAAPGPSLRKLFVFDPLLVWKVRSLLERDAFDVIHAHHYEGLITALIARRMANRVPIVYDAHTLLATELPFYRLPTPAKASAWVGRCLDGWLPRKADHIIAVTAAMREWLTSRGRAPDDSVSLIQNGVEYEHFGAPLERRPSVRGQAGRANRDAPPAARIVYTGNLAAYQGVDLLLSAFRKVRAQVPHAELVLVTDFQREPMEAQIEEEGLAGSVSTVAADYDTLPERLAEADVLVNPRPNCEGLPQKLLNYMASGRPIVSFAGSAGPLRHERTALLVPDQDTDGFARAITSVLQNPELGRRLGQAAREEVIAAYGWRQVAERVEGVYSKVTTCTPAHLVLSHDLTKR